jgi:phenylacetic acid degradation operon negative regulatory protein
MQRGSARSTLLNALGELVHPDNAPAPTSALLRVLTEVGHEPPTARQAITRCMRIGWLDGGRRGRETWWTLTLAGTRLVADGIRRVEALGGEPAPWDGRWLVLLVTVPNDVRSVRQRLYRSLSWAGFGSPEPGVWLSPYPEREAGARSVVRRLALEAHAMAFVGNAADVGLTDADIVARAWQLAEVERHYAELVGRFTARHPVTPRDTLRELLALDQELQRLPMLDPWLPPELAPGSRGRAAAIELLRLRAAWLPRARAFWTSVSG